MFGLLRILPRDSLSMCMLMFLLVMVKEFAPIIEKALVMEFLMESIAVVMPMRAIRPMAIITIVSMVLKELDFIDNQEIRRFSFRNVPARISFRLSFIGFLKYEIHSENKGVGFVVFLVLYFLFLGLN